MTQPLITDTHLQNHRNQFPCNLCRCLADSPTALWLSGALELWLVLSCFNNNVSCICIYEQRLCNNTGDGYVFAWFSPDHARGSVAHGCVFGLNEFLVVVDATVNFIILFPRKLLVAEKKLMWRVRNVFLCRKTMRTVKTFIKREICKDWSCTSCIFWLLSKMAWASLSRSVSSS